MTILQKYGDYNLRPKPYVQNRYGWCWIAAAKMVALAYKNNDLSLHDVETDDYTNIAWDNIGVRGGKVYIDYCQQAIFRAVSKEIGDLDCLGDDTSKEMALRYMLAGNCRDKKINVVTLGQFNRCFLKDEVNKIENIVRNGYAFIANGYVSKLDAFHSFAILPWKPMEVKIFDPWNGNMVKGDMQQIRKMFTWIQFIEGEYYV